MQSYELSLNKLILLYILRGVGVPLTNSQLTEFILDKGYTSYFNIQEYIHQMIDSDLIRTISNAHTTTYEITGEGLKTLDFFESRITEGITQDIDAYLKQNKYVLKNEAEVLSEYVPTNDGDYLVHLQINENKKTLIDLTINVFNKDYAVKICDDWKNNCHKTYKLILDELMDQE